MKHRVRLKRRLKRLHDHPPSPWVPTGYYNNRPWLTAWQGTEIGFVESVRFACSLAK